MLAAPMASKKGSSSDGDIMRLRKPVCRTTHMTSSCMAPWWQPYPDVPRAAMRSITPQRYGATRELRSVRSGRFGHQPAASEFCRKCGKSTTVDGLPVVREEALVSAVTEAMYDRMNGHGHHMELPNGYSVGPSDPKAWPFLTAFDDPKVYAMRELHALCEAHFMDPMDDSDALRDVMG
eukprot:jgi/Tetstr1/440357/TSEL_028693.t1